MKKHLPDTLNPDFKIDLSRLPTHGIDRISRFKSISSATLWFVAFFVPLYIYIDFRQNRPLSTLEILFGLIFTFICAKMFIHHIKEIGHKVLITITPHHVSLQAKQLFSSDKTTEPLKNYLGVHDETFLVFNPYAHKPRIKHLVYLQHKHNDHLCIPLAATFFRDEKVRPYWEKASKKLGLPAIENTATGLLFRNPKDLNKPLVQLIKEKKIKMPKLTKKTPPTSMQLIKNHLKIFRPALNVFNLLAPTLALFLFFSVFWIFIGFEKFEGFHLISVWILGPLFAFLLFVTTVSFLNSQQTTLISFKKKNHLTLTTRLFFIKCHETDIKIKDIEEIFIIKRLAYHQPFALKICTDKQNYLLEKVCLMLI